MPPNRRRPSQEFIKDITVVDDGIRPVRHAHDWTRDKLGILTSYLGAYGRACQRAGEFYFVDAMAGPGLYRIEETGEWLLGSTPIALKSAPPFAQCLAMDVDERNVLALRRRIDQFGPRATVLQGDANSDLVGAMGEFVPRNRPSFILLDPEGAELHWETVRGVAAHRQGALKSELLILFATEGVNRMLPVEADIELHNEMALNILFPPQSRWRETWQRRRSGEISPAEARVEYVAGYVRGLEAAGYASVLPREIRRPNGSLVYHLIFASDHPAGERIMRDVFGTMNPNDPQQRLFL
ncbi:MAG: three-Cys-motif partner protein TcmP [Chloroflexi bacterium]|nr:three-Cys-motif partner protein TcmP [Chloroflexota bacterium]